MVLNDIIEQAAGRHSRASDRGGIYFMNITCYVFTEYIITCKYVFVFVFRMLNSLTPFHGDPFVDLPDVRASVVVYYCT